MAKKNLNMKKCDESHRLTQIDTDKDIAAEIRDLQVIL
jgi:hypothetical protein